MQELNPELLRELLADRQGPCISIYQPTSRHYPGTSGDPIAYRNNLKQVEQMLQEAAPKGDLEPLLEPLRRYTDDGDFWRHQLDGLGVFCAPGLLRVVRFQRPVEPVVVVADTFHTRPLIRIMQSADRYEVLCVSQRQVKLYRGTRDALDEVELRNVPKDIVEALGEELRGGKHQTVASYGMGTAGAAKRHGHGGRKDEQDIDIERYMRAIDRAVWENHSRASGLPLMLAAVDEYHAEFHKVSHNQNLLKEGIRNNPDWMEPDRLREEAWKVHEPIYLKRISDAVDQYRTARPRGAGEDNIAQVSESAAVGRVGTLLVDEGRRVWGRVDRGTGRVELAEKGQPGVVDVLDEVAEQVLRTDGQVFVIPTEQMPSKTGLAAIYRY
jgi:hypothetical protein